jgi:hypothetical protein
LSTAGQRRIIVKFVFTTNKLCISLSLMSRTFAALRYRRKHVSQHENIGRREVGLRARNTRSRSGSNGPPRFDIDHSACVSRARSRQRPIPPAPAGRSARRVPWMISTGNSSDVSCSTHSAGGAFRASAWLPLLITVGIFEFFPRNARAIADCERRQACDKKGIRVGHSAVDASHQFRKFSEWQRVQ